MEWPDRLREVCAELRHAMLACTDGADVVATVWAFGLGAAAPVAEMEKVLTDAEVPDELVAVASRTLVHYVFGHAFEEQTARQAVSLGAVERSLESLPDFDLGPRPGHRRPAGPPRLARASGTMGWAMRGSEPPGRP